MKRGNYNTVEFSRIFNSYRIFMTAYNEHGERVDKTITVSEYYQSVQKLKAMGFKAEQKGN